MYSIDMCPTYNVHIYRNRPWFDPDTSSVNNSIYAFLLVNNVVKDKQGD